MIPHVGIWATAGAGIGVLLVWLAGATDPVISVLSVSALVGFAAYAWGDRDPSATVTARLLLAIVYVTVGVRHPTPLGVAVGMVGVAFGVFACVAARKSISAEALRARLRLTVRTSDGACSAEIEVIGAASARVAVRRSAKALGVRREQTQCRLERAGAPLDPERSLDAAGLRSGDVLTLVMTDQQGPRDRVSDAM